MPEDDMMAVMWHGQGAPRRIVIEPAGKLWRFEVQADDGTVFDYSLSSSQRQAWAMARLSWRRLSKAAARGERLEKRP